MNNRPSLTKQLPSEEFQAYYWLKEELVTFCRTEGLPTAGGKQEITQRIVTYLTTGEIVKPVRKSTKQSKMPSKFTTDTVIEDGWRCSQGLRGFFEQEIGKSFHFNQFLRDFIQKDGIGRTLQEAINGWHISKSQPKGSSEIGEQFEYNRYMRQYLIDNPTASRQDAVASWNIYKTKRKN